jgi:hypothetical protein
MPEACSKSAIKLVTEVVDVLNIVVEVVKDDVVLGDVLRGYVVVDDDLIVGMDVKFLVGLLTEVVLADDEVAVDIGMV